MTIMAALGFGEKRLLSRFIQCGILCITFWHAPKGFPADISVGAGGGAGEGDDVQRFGVYAVGFTAGWPHATRHRIQADYRFLRQPGEDGNRSHFVTAAYVLQSTNGRARPFFEAGAGLVHRRTSGQVSSSPGSPVRFHETDNSLALLAGTGATVELSSRFFLRPEVKIYGYVGPSVAVISGLSFGWLF